MTVESLVDSSSHRVHSSSSSDGIPTRSEQSALFSTMKRSSGSTSKSAPERHREGKEEPLDAQEISTSSREWKGDGVGTEGEHFLVPLRFEESGLDEPRSEAEVSRLAKDEVYDPGEYR